MREIYLTKGQITLVDDEDFHFISQWDWYAQFVPATGKYYASRRPWKQAQQYMHTIIGERMGFIGEIDHKDRDSLNNQRNNIRLATRNQNMWNIGIRSNNTSGYKGVSYHKQSGKFNARIK